MIVHDVEQGTDAWLELRAGLPTASMASKMVTGTGKKSTSITEYAYQLAAEMYAGKPLDGFDGNGYTDRGKELEPLARIAYEQHTHVWVEEVGFCTVDDGSYGCSPDGLVGDDGMVEFKCLIAKNHTKAWMYYDENKSVQPEYVSQPQMQMLVCERKWCDSVFYHPDLPLLIIRQFPGEEFQKVLAEQLKVCIERRDNALKVMTSG